MGRDRSSLRREDVSADGRYHNPQGIVIYDGAIDDKPTTDLSDISGATNYVNLSLKQAMAGKQVETPATRPYGCSVKYSDSSH